MLHMLGKKRRVSALGDYRNIGFYHDGAYDCDWVSPYTKSACNINADVMVVLQDWASDSDLSKTLDPDVVEYGLTPNAPTNTNLKNLLWTHLKLELKDVFVTNMFPFVKLGAMSDSIPIGAMLRAARDYCQPQIDIVRPALVICTGIAVFNVLRRIHKFPRVKNADEGIKSPFVVGATTYYCQSHPGMLGKNNRQRHGRRDQVAKDWETMAKVLKGQS